MNTCTFVTNVYENTYRSLLSPGELSRKISDHLFRFHERLLVINNVLDKEDAARLAREALERGEIDRFVFVEDELSRALKIC